MTLTNSSSFVRKANEPENGTIAAETVTTTSDDDNNEKKCTFQQVKFQYLAICCANIIILGQGCAMGWTSPSLPILQSTSSPLANGPLTVAESSWVGSMSSIGAAIGTIFFGLITRRIGSKNSMVLCALPLTIFWISVLYARYAWHLYVGRFLSGLTGGAFVCIQLFIADVSDEKIRGQLGSFLTLYVNVGILIGFVGGTYLDYAIVPYIMIVFPVIFFCAFILMPDTPQYLLKRNRNDEAEQSLRFYKSCKVGEDDAKLKIEFSNLKAIAEQSSQRETLCLDDFLTPKAIRALLVGPVLMAVNQFSGTLTLINYAATIFTESGSSIDPNVSAIVMACLQICGTYCTSLLIDRVGRKCMLIISCGGSAIGLSIMGVYSFMSVHGYDVDAMRLVPVLSLSFVIFVASMGIIPIPYIIIAEVLPRKIRDVGTTICTTTVSVYAFIMLKSFPYLLMNLQLYGCMLVFLCVALSGVLFTALFVPETKGKQLDVLSDMEKNENGH